MLILNANAKRPVLRRVLGDSNEHPAPTVDVRFYHDRAQPKDILDPCIVIVLLRTLQMTHSLIFIFRLKRHPLPLSSHYRRPQHQSCCVNIPKRRTNDAHHTSNVGKCGQLIPQHQRAVPRTGPFHLRSDPLARLNGRQRHVETFTDNASLPLHR